MRKSTIVLSLLAAIPMLTASPGHAGDIVPDGLHLLTAVEIKAVLTDVSWQFVTTTTMDAPNVYAFHSDGTFSASGGRATYGGKIVVSKGLLCLVVDPEYPGECWRVLRDERYNIYFAPVFERRTYAPELVTLEKFRQ